MAAVAVFKAICAAYAAQILDAIATNAVIIFVFITITSAVNAAAKIPFKKGESLIASITLVNMLKNLDIIGANISPKDAASAFTDSSSPACVASNLWLAVIIEL